MDDVVSTYLAALAARLGDVLGDTLVGVYAGGSYALGGYEAGRSDLDVAAVVRAPIGRPVAEAIVDAIRHEALPCPARGLEFVVYTLDTTREPTIEAGIELNLNTGAAMPFRADFGPDTVEPFWFPIDRSILAQHGVAISGPPTEEVFTDLPREALLPVVVESLAWYVRNVQGGTELQAAASRAWRYAAEGVWSSKPDALSWAGTRSTAVRSRRK